MRSSVAFLLCCLAPALGASLDSDKEVHVQAAQDSADRQALAYCALQCNSDVNRDCNACKGAGANHECALQCVKNWAKCWCACKDVKATSTLSFNASSASSLAVLEFGRRILGSSDGDNNDIYKVYMCTTNKAFPLIDCQDMKTCMATIGQDPVACLATWCGATTARVREVAESIGPCSDANKDPEDDVAAFADCALKCRTVAVPCYGRCGTSDSCRLQCAKDEAKCYCACKDVKASTRLSYNPASLADLSLDLERRFLGSSSMGDDNGPLDTYDKVVACMEHKASPLMPCVQRCISSANIGTCLKGCTTSAEVREVLEAVCPCSAAAFLQQSMFLVFAATLVAWLSNEQ